MRGNGITFRILDFMQGTIRSTISVRGVVNVRTLSKYKLQERVRGRVGQACRRDSDRY